MVLKLPSATSPVAGPPTTVARKPLTATRHRADPHVATTPPCHQRGPSMILVCPIRSRNFVAGPAPNETNEITCRYRKCVFSYDECLMRTPSRYDFCPCRDTNWSQSRTPTPTDIFRLPLHPLPATLESAQLYAPALRPSPTIGRGDMRLPHPRAMGALLRKDERRKGATSQIELNPLRSPAIAQISLKSATKKRAADTSSLQSMKSSYAAYEAHGGAKSVGPAP